MHTSGIFGHGFSDNEKLLQVPIMQSELVFNYIVHTFGWLGAAVIITLIISFIYRILHISKYVRDSYGGSLCLINMLSVGIIMSVYRRRSLSI